MYHQITILGHLGKEPSLRMLPDGTQVCSFSVATNRKWKDANGETHEDTTWFNVTAWGKQAENANQYLQKGASVMVQGTLKADNDGRPRLWQRQDGTVASSFEVTADIIRFIHTPL